MLADPDPDAATRTLGMLSAELLERIGPVLGSSPMPSTGPELQDLLGSTRAERREGTRTLLVRRSGAPPGPALDRAVDVVRALISPEVALLLTDQRGSTREEYGRRLGDCVAEQVHRLR